MFHELSGLALLSANWFGIYGICCELAARKQIHSDWRVSWLLACVGWGALLTFVIELSSARKMLNAPVLIAAWLAGNTIKEKPADSALGTALILAGLPIYLLGRRALAP